MKKKEVIVMYEIIRDRLKLYSNHGLIREKEIESVMGALFHIPKTFRHIIIDELIDLEYLKGSKDLQKRQRMFEVN